MDAPERFVTGYRDGLRDAKLGTERRLCVTSGGSEPAIVKRDDPLYYHAYKQALKDGSSGRSSLHTAWLGFRTKHRGKLPALSRNGRMQLLPEVSPTRDGFGAPRQGARVLQPVSFRGDERVNAYLSHEGRDQILVGLGDSPHMLLGEWTPTRGIYFPDYQVSSSDVAAWGELGEFDEAARRYYEVLRERYGIEPGSPLPAPFEMTKRAASPKRRKRIMKRNAIDTMVGNSTFRVTADVGVHRENPSSLGPIDSEEEGSVSENDNTFGSGYVEAPPALRSLGRYMDSLKPTRWLDHSVFLNTREHMITVEVDHKFSITASDLNSLLYWGLVRMQSNHPGTMSFYFRDSELG